MKYRRKLLREAQVYIKNSLESINILALTHATNSQAFNHYLLLVQPISLNRKKTPSRKIKFINIFKKVHKFLYPYGFCLNNVGIRRKQSFPFCHETSHTCGMQPLCHSWVGFDPTPSCLCSILWPAMSFLPYVRVWAMGSMNVACHWVNYVSIVKDF